MARKKILPKWCKDAQKAMIDKDLDVEELAEMVGCSRQYIAAVINDRAKSEPVCTKITRILEIEPPEGSLQYYTKKGS